jgi:hypothetical protein
MLTCNFICSVCACACCHRCDACCAPGLPQEHVLWHRTGRRSNTPAGGENISPSREVAVSAFMARSVHQLLCTGCPMQAVVFSAVINRLCVMSISLMNSCNRLARGECSRPLLCGAFPSFDALCCQQLGVLGCGLCMLSSAGDLASHRAQGSTPAAVKPPNSMAFWRTAVCRGQTLLPFCQTAVLQHAVDVSCALFGCRAAVLPRHRYSYQAVMLHLFLALSLPAVVHLHSGMLTHHWTARVRA